MKAMLLDKVAKPVSLLQFGTSYFRGDVRSMQRDRLCA
jgi:hypothetical protein